jgi:ElaB/YqjD/DUF883 family membrane-anchored ribosome-binding protein
MSTGSLMDTVRENPISSALVGLGLGWALAGGLKKLLGGVDWESAREKMEEMTSGTSAEEMKSKMQDYAETAKDKAEQARYEAMQWGSQAVEYLKENPFLAVGAALAIGAAVGLGVSYMSSRMEEEEGEDVFFCATCGAPLESETGTSQSQ